MKLVELFIRNLQWLIILNAGLTYYNELDEHEKQVENILAAKPSIEEQIVKENKKVDEAKIFMANLESSKKRVLEVAGQIEQVQKQLPNQINDTEVLDFFTTESSNLNIKPSVSPGEEKPNDFYFIKRYSFKGVGTYLQFLIYMERINSSDRLINVQSVKISNSGERQKGRFQMLNMEANFEGFRYNQSFKEETGIDKIEQVQAEEKPKKKRKRKSGASDE